MADAASPMGTRSTPIVDGNDALVDAPRETELDGERLRSPDCKAGRTSGQTKKIAAQPANLRKDTVDDEGGIQTIRVSNAASSHWLAIDGDCSQPLEVCPDVLDSDANFHEEQLEMAKPYKTCAAGHDGETLQGPHNWRKRLKPVLCQESCEIRREPRKDSEHATQERCLRDRRLSRDDHGDDAKSRGDKIRISPSAKKELTVLRAKGQLISKSSRSTPAQQSPNPLMSKSGRKGTKSSTDDSESAFTRQVVKPMKSSVVQRSRAIYPSSYMATKNISPPFAFTGKKLSQNHMDPFGTSGPVTAKMVEKVMKARFYLLQQTGPNSFLIGDDSPDHKYRVIIGPQKCSCVRESLCVHLLFVMLRVFQVPQNDPILSRKPLKNYEVEALFRNYHARRTSRLKDNAKKKISYRQELQDLDGPSQKAEGEVRGDGEDDDDNDVASMSAIDQDADGIEKEEEEELCSICLLPMVEGESLTECKTGCQNRLHCQCIAIWFEECRRQKEPLICPLCRAEWKTDQGNPPLPVPRPDLLCLPLTTRETSPQVANAEASALPIEPLPPEHREMAEKWIPVVGEDIVLRLFSKNWGVREGALRLLSQEAVGVLLLGVGEGRSGVLVSPERQANNHTMLECCCAILAFSLSDPVYKVFVSGLRALRMILSYTPCRDDLQQNRLQLLMKPVVKSLLLKCADSNRKTSQLSISALEELVKGQDGELALGREIVNPGNHGLGGIGYLIDCIVEIDAVENLHWQWVLGRLCMLERLLEEYSHEFTMTLPSAPPESEITLVDWIISSANYDRTLCILRFCTFYMSFSHIKVSKMARRVFYYIARLLVHAEAVFTKACHLLDDVEAAVQSHMKRKLYALVTDFRETPANQGSDRIKPEQPAPKEVDAVALPGPSPAPSGLMPNGTAPLPRVCVMATSPATDVVTVLLSGSAASASAEMPTNQESDRINKGASVDQVDGPRVKRSETTSSVGHEEAKSKQEIPHPQVEYVDACVATSPLPNNGPEMWTVDKIAESEFNISSISTNISVITAERAVESGDSGLCQMSKPPDGESVALRPDNVEVCSLSRQNKLRRPFNSSVSLHSQASSKESLFDSPPILSGRIGAELGERQVGLLTEDLSDLILSSGSEEKVSFKTEVATTPQNSPQRSANNTADDGCHCKEEVEREEAEALAEALERSDLPQDALPHVPGLSRGKSDGTLTIHLQDQSMVITNGDGFDSRHQYQEGVHWKRGPVLGTGAFSTCYQARDNRTGTLMAVKQISFCRNTLSEQEKVINSVKEEIHILGRLCHPNVIRILGATQQGCHFFMFVEWMPGCSVAALLDRYGQFSEQVITSYTLQMLRGLTYLHDNQVLHRDLKGANLLVDSTGNRVRIGDFGAAARLATRLTGAGEFEGQLLGTIAFMAPEVLRGDAYGRKCDIWSFGCTMVEMATAQPPWGANDISNHLALIFKIASTVRPPPIPENLSPPIRDVMLRCLEVNPEDRPVSKDLLKHPLFRI